MELSEIDWFSRRMYLDDLAAEQRELADWRVALPEDRPDPFDLIDVNGKD